MPPTPTCIPYAKRPNLTVITGGLVERVMMADDADGPVARGVVYRGESGDTVEVAARREVVLAAGAIGSPHLLMLSGIGDPDRLAAAGVPVAVRSLEVGRNLQDHLASGWIVHTPTAVTMVDAEKLGQVVKYLARRKGMLSSNVAEAVAMVHTEDGLAGTGHRDPVRAGAVPRPRLHRATGARLHGRVDPAAAAQRRRDHADEPRSGGRTAHRPALPVR